jgi:4-hydroxyphenylpyruvate dioxygenase-like putative hemolysin
LTFSKGVQHIAFRVDDFGKSIKALADSGIPVLHQGYNQNLTGGYAYIDSAKTLGVSLELVHSAAKK